MKAELRVKKTIKQQAKEQRQNTLKALAEKKAKGKLTIEDLDAKLDTILEMLSST